MKKINLLLVSLLVVFSGVFTSCEEDTTESTFDFSGSEGYISGNVTVDAGSALKFKWTITSNTDMETMDITKNDSYLAGWADYEIPNASKNTFIGEATTTADVNAGVYTYEFVVYDKDGNPIISKSIVVTVVSSTPLTSVNTGKIYHIQAATGNGAWDLVANAAKYAADAAASKDMIQASTNTSGSDWVAGWNVGAGNSTMFVKANTYDYTNATLESAKAAYLAGTASNQIRSVVANDIYIAKLRGQDSYAVIKITKMDPLDATGTAGSNKGVVEFSYKK